MGLELQSLFHAFAVEHPVTQVGILRSMAEFCPVFVEKPQKSSSWSMCLKQVEYIEKKNKKPKQTVKGSVSSWMCFSSTSLFYFFFFKGK